MKNIIIKNDKVVRVRDTVKEGFLCDLNRMAPEIYDENKNTFFDIPYACNSS